MTRAITETRPVLSQGWGFVICSLFEDNTLWPALLCTGLLLQSLQSQVQRGLSMT